MKLSELKKIIGSQAKDIIGPTLEKWNGKKGCCCLHEETRPSMSWDENRLRFKCFAGCGTYDIADHYKKLFPDNYIDELYLLAGVENESKFKLSPQGKTFLLGRGIKGDYGKHITADDYAIYFNCFRNNKLYNYKKRKLFPANKSDRFLGGIKGKSYDLFLKYYNIDYKKTLYCTEGETDCLTLRELGLQAVSYGGSSSIKVIKDSIKYFAKFNKVIFVCDGDAAGIKQYDRLNDVELKNAFRLLMPKDLNDVNNVYLKLGEDKLKEILKEGIKCDGYEKQLLENSELKDILLNHFETCNNIYRKDEKTFIVTNTKNKIFVSGSRKDITSASGINVTEYSENYKYFSAILANVFSDYSHKFPECSSVGYDITRAYGDIYKDNLGENVLNLCRTTGLYDKYDADKTITTKDFSYIHKHFIHMYKDNADYVYKILGWNLQYLSNPSKVAIVHQSKEHGSGKGLMGKLWIKIFNNFDKVSQSDLKIDFNGFLRKKIIIAEEISIDDKRMADRMKAYITEDTNSLNIKKERVITVDNYSQWIINTNRSIPVFLEESDRRYFVCQQTKLLDDDLIDNLDLIYNQRKPHEEIINLIKYCKALKVTRSDLKNIPMTDIKKKIISNGVSKTEESLKELIEDFVGEIHHLQKTKSNKSDYFRTLKENVKSDIESFKEIRISIKDFREVVKTKLNKPSMKNSTIDRYVDELEGISKPNNSFRINGTKKRGYKIKLEQEDEITPINEGKILDENPWAKTDHQFNY
jgi:hypothetical protein